MSPPLSASLYSGADNRFFVFEEREQQAARDWPALARELCARTLFDACCADGLLVVGESAEAEACMTIYNADGGRPEACGNGLRCVGWHLARTRGLREACVMTDAGPRRVRVETRAGESAILDAEMGRARELGAIDTGMQDVAREAHGYDLGNPHCILVVEDERFASVERLGRALQSHAAFPRGVNVGFLAQREGSWYLRVFERGVGETAACGTNACAAAAYLFERKGTRAARLHMPGGVLQVSAREDGALVLRGTARFHGTRELTSRRGESTA